MERLARKKNLHILAITDHDRLTLVKGKEIIFIPGEEIKTQKGEIIGLGISEEIPPGLSPEETADRIREQGGLVVFPHPFDAFRRRTALLLNWKPTFLPDAVEVINARCILWRHVERAREFARKNNLPMLGSSDAHTSLELGNAYTIFPPVNDVDEALEAIRKGLVQPAGRLSPPWVHIFSMVRRITTRFK